MNNKIRDALDGILRRFKDGSIPPAIALSTFPKPDIPSAKWSLTNRIIQFLNGTQDARGFNQWKLAKRHVKKGAKAFLILAPYLTKVRDVDEEDGKLLLQGFIAVPVFRVEDTDGEPLDYQKYHIPELPLLNRAKAWGISVTTVPGNCRYLGYYSLEREEIILASEEECVFFHELAHASHKRVMGELQPGQRWKQEIVAELSAQVLCHLVGRKPGASLGNSYQYIESYAKEADLTPHAACLKVISDVEKCLKLILSTADTGENQEEEHYEEIMD